MKILAKYFVTITVLLLMIVLWGYVGYLSRTYSNRTFSLNYGYIVIRLLIGYSIGAILGLDYFINELRKEGKWRFNISKVILVGLPSLYISLTFIWFYSNVHFLQNVIAYPLLKLMIYFPDSVPLFQLVFGYTIITSFYKTVNRIKEK